jgi:hypothetical protein
MLRFRVVKRDILGGARVPVFVFGESVLKRQLGAAVNHDVFSLADGASKHFSGLNFGQLH